MKKIENDKNIFNELDREMEQMETERKLSNLKRMLKITIKTFQGFIIFMFTLSVSLIYLGIFKGHKEVNISMGIMSFFLAICCLVFLKIISKSQPKKGEKR